MLWSTLLITCKRERNQKRETEASLESEAERQRKRNSSCTLLEDILINSQYVAQSLCLQFCESCERFSNLTEQAFPFVFHQDSSMRRVEDRQKWKVRQILRLFGPAQSKTLCNCPTFALVFVCFPVWIHSITLLPMMVHSFCLLLFLSRLCALSPCHYSFPFFDLLSFSINCISLTFSSLYFGSNQFS